MSRNIRVSITHLVLADTDAILQITDWLVENISEACYDGLPYKQRTAKKYIKEGRRSICYGDGWHFYLMVGQTINIGHNGEWFVEFKRKNDAALFILRWV